VRVRGNTIPPSILGRFAILCAILRQLLLILQIAIFTSELRQLKPQYFFVDQLSAGVPLLRTISPSTRILFYCHFPDKLLARRGSWIKFVYRLPFDWIENWSTGCSDGIIVNSNFTKGIFGEAFPLLKNRDPNVVYPCVDTTPSTASKDDVYFPDHKILLSINRFERKKDIGLAIKAFAQLAPEVQRNARLILAGLCFPVIILTYNNRWLRSSSIREC
jgi:alpha-1,3/alpha-1,6-mannosyltransferase